MAAKGAELEVDHFFAHRLELHGVGNGEPRRLLFEDHLGLLIELGAFCHTRDDFGFAQDAFIMSVVIFYKNIAELSIARLIGSRFSDESKWQVAC
jgi:hypothetical protein